MIDPSKSFWGHSLALYALVSKWPVIESGWP